MVLVDSHRISPVPWYSGTPLGSVVLRLQDYHLLRCCFPDQLRLRRVTRDAGPTTPQPPKRLRFGLFPVRSPLLRESRLFSFPPGTEMFQFPGFASQGLCIQPRDDRSSTGRVAPFGNPRIYACLQLPVAYRSLSRPSSPVHAKASTIRPYLLKPYRFTSARHLSLGNAR